VKPAGHKHLNPPCLFTQRAPFLHGLYGKHSLTSAGGKYIEKSISALVRLEQIRRGEVLSEHMVKDRSFAHFEHASTFLEIKMCLKPVEI